MFCCAVKALDDAQEQLLEQEEENERLQAEIKALRAGKAPPNAENNEEEAPPTPTNVQAALPYSEAEGKAVRTAGRRCCVLHMPWMRAEFWQEHRFALAEPVDVVREVVSHLDTELARKWFQPWFKQQFKLGMRKMRSEAVNEVADQRYLVFRLTDEEFGERRGQRRRGPGAKALFEDDAYLWDPLEDADDGRTEDERFFRSQPVLRATKLLFSSPSSVDSEVRSAQAGLSRAEAWGIKFVTPSMLSFVSVVVHFVLSGDRSFDRVTPTSNYVSIYEDNLKLLRVHRRKHRVFYDELITLYNMSVLPHIYSAEDGGDKEVAGMTSGRKAYYLRKIMEASDGEDGDGN
ncbi:hypothetical protein FS749_005411 [Ceratobasidium sp. UAMH 11750]|nr:hypothetical protein FS749_005411 [Ceratobasidium sp. UAMH 11750]